MLNQWENNKTNSKLRRIKTPEKGKFKTYSITNKKYTLFCVKFKF